MTTQESAPLQPVLRLIHCIQKGMRPISVHFSFDMYAPFQQLTRYLLRCTLSPLCQERGASCALVGSLSLAQPDVTDGSFEVHQYESNLRSARTASNSAIKKFYRLCGKKLEEGDLDIATMLFTVRQLVDGGVGDESEYLFFHDVLVEYNSFLQTIVKVFLVDEVAKRKKEMQTKIDAPKMENESRRNAKVALSLLDLILSFVTLKESLGTER